MQNFMFQLLLCQQNLKLSKLLSEGFKRSIYWNEYKVTLKVHDENSNIREKLGASLQGINRLFVLAYAHDDNITNQNSSRKYFLPRLKIKNYN